MEAWILIFFTSLSGLTSDNMYELAEKEIYLSLAACEHAAERQLVDDKTSYICVEAKK